MTRRDLWAFFVGMALQGMLFSYLLRSPALFLLNGLLLGYDGFMFYREVTK